MTLPKILENTANVAIILLVLILGFFLVRNYLKSPPPENFIKTGEPLQIASIDFSKSDHNLLVFLRHDCEFCKKSANFYQRLVRRASGDDRIQLIALFSEETIANQVFLADLRPTFQNALIVPFVEIRVNATPTILDIDRTGVVRSVWKGKLSEEREQEFMAALK